MSEGYTTPVPNALLDMLLPGLKDTELRVLLVVIRTTHGWRDGKGRTKARDWLSSSQLRRRTGRGSEAVSGAVDALVRKRLLVVQDAAGRPLLTTDERRRHLGRLYYRVASLENLGEKMGKTDELCQPGKAKTTKVSRYK